MLKRESNWLEASRFAPARAIRLSRACSPSRSSAPSTCGKTDGFRQGVLVGSSAVLAVSLIVTSFLLGLNLARSSGSPTPVAKVADDKPAACEQPVEPKAPVAVAAIKAAASKPVEPKAPVIKVVDSKPNLVNPPAVKVPAKVVDKIEVLAWYERGRRCPGDSSECSGDLTWNHLAATTIASRPIWRAFDNSATKVLIRQAANLLHPVLEPLQVFLGIGPSRSKT